MNLIAQFIVTLFACVNALHVRQWADVGWNSDDRLETNWLLFDSNCDISRVNSTDQQIVATMDSSLSSQFASIANSQSNKCVAVCLQHGMLQQDITHILPQQIYQLTNEENTFEEWLNGCQRAELGIISYYPNSLEIHFVDTKGTKHFIDTVKHGERQVIWIDTYLGHRFYVSDSSTGETLREVEVKYSEFLRFGEHVTDTNVTDVTVQDIKLTLHNEVLRSNRIRRTFTSSGFAKGRLPADLWASINTYYYNNQHAFGVLEWAGKGYYVNWWEVPVQFLGIPVRLKRYWQNRLKSLVEAWVATPLENTDIYGIRRYTDGARLLTHVDREATHAVSLIVNIAQGGMRSPWKLEIYDFEGNLHQVAMTPGDIIYYESARCLHGRMRPLAGAYFDNLFSHYRPVGDPQWYTRENPNKQATSIADDHCEANDSTLTSKVVKTGEDLFNYWKEVTPVGGFGFHG